MVILDVGAKQVVTGADPGRTRIAAKTTENDDDLRPPPRRLHQVATVKTVVENDQRIIVRIRLRVIPLARDDAGRRVREVVENI